MQSGIKAALTAPILLALVGFVTPATLSAQTGSARPSPAVIQLGALSRERAERWADATPAIHCSPAPLTERPAAFLDAVVVKRTFASRATRGAR